VWTAASTGSIDINGPWTIGAFGSGSNPIISAAADGIILLPQGSNSAPAISDWRFMDLNLTPNGHVGVSAFRMIDGGHMVNQVLLLRVNGLAQFGSDIGWGTYNQTNVFFVDSSVAGLHYAHYSYGLTNSAIMGCSVSTTSTTDLGEGLYRLEGHTGMVISNNTFTGNQSGRPQIKLNAASRQSSKLVVSDNKFNGGNGVFPFDIAPQNNVSDERLTDWIIERNWWVNSGHWFRMINLSGRKGTVRNNILDGSLANPGADNASIYVSQLGIEPAPDDIQIYNNTFYSRFTDTSNAFQGIVLTTGTNLVVKNNLAFAPNYTTVQTVVDSASGTVKSNNSTNVQAKSTNPLFASPTPSVPADFMLQTSSYAKDTGTTAPVFSDFFQTSRPSGASVDLGATEF
jgi:hypothetical protein